jgi:hypothetical protein
VLLTRCLGASDQPAPETIVTESPASATPLSARLDGGTKLDRGWAGTIYPDAGELVGVSALLEERDQGERSRVRLAGSSPRAAASESRPESTERAERRARGQIRRYAVVNGCTRLVTLTYADQHDDPVRARRDLSAFTRRLRRAYPDLRWVRVFERHASGMIHVHLAVSRFVPKADLAALWGHGFVDVRKIRSKRGAREDARQAARYVAKYVRKDAWADPGEHRYEVREGYQARRVAVLAWSWAELLAAASSYQLTGEPAYVWDSATSADWTGPPVRFAAF